MARIFEPQELALGWYTPEELTRISVCEVTVPASFDMFCHPVPDGLYDERLGPLDSRQACRTCRAPHLACPGHFGHITLSRPILHPLLFDTLFLLLRSSCFQCGSFKITDFERLVHFTRLAALARGIRLSAPEEFVRNRSIEEIKAALETTAGSEAATRRLHQQWATEFLQHTGQKLKCPRCLFRAPKLTRGLNMRVLIEFKQAVDTPADNTAQNTAEDTADTFDSSPESTAESTESSRDTVHRFTDLLEPSGEQERADARARWLSPAEARTQLERLYSHEQALLETLFGAATRTDSFFLSCLPVTPNRFRPPRHLDNRISENQVNTALARIIATSAAAEGDVRAWPDLQAHVLAYFDGARAATPTTGIKQVIEKKEGLFRRNIMGKRVNYAARSVISPDPNLHAREVGVPLVFAQALTFPERVTACNIDRLRAAVARGPAYPGANFVETVAAGRGRRAALTSLAHVSAQARLAIANQLGDGEKIVWRHLLDGDPVLMNRQPTLHAVSMMGHTVRVLRNENTLRIHYVNCKPYNADFDGDEMGMHFPQTYAGHVETALLAHNDRNYVLASTGRPIRGLEQDHVVAAAQLTMKGEFFTADEFAWLVQGALRECAGRLRLPRAAVQAPVKLFTGKQAVSCVLLNIGLPLDYEAAGKLAFPVRVRAGARLSVGAAQGFVDERESRVRVRGGRLITGVLDKGIIGAAKFSLVHACTELGGPRMCNDVLTAISRVVNAYIALRGFTVRFDDLLMDTSAETQRTAIFGAAEASARQLFYMEIFGKNPDNGENSTKSARSSDSGPDKSGETSSPAENPAPSDHKTHLGHAYYQNPEATAILDARVRSLMNTATSQTVELLESGLLKKPPTNNMENIIRTAAKGSIVNLSQICCALGQQELEGRRVPVMPSGKTLACFRPLEPSPAAGGYVYERFLTGINPATFFFHCMAGREGLVDTAVKTAGSGYLQRCLVKHLESLSVAYDLSVRDASQIIQYRYGDDAVDPAKEAYLTSTDFFRENIHLSIAFSRALHSKLPIFSESLLSPSFKTLIKNLQESSLDSSSGNAVLNNAETLVDSPITCMATADSATPAATQDPHSNNLTALSDFMKYKFTSALIEPGKAVGVVAAQSIGEPSTQMTLNTFHLAGVAGRNVTLGIPRLSEILMRASKKIKTPLITVKVRGTATATLDSLVALLSPKNLADCLAAFTVHESVRTDRSEYSKQVAVTFELNGAAPETAVAAAIDRDFLGLLTRELRRRSAVGGIVERPAGGARGAAGPAGPAGSLDERGGAAGEADAPSEEDEEESDGPSSENCDAAVAPEDHSLSEEESRDTAVESTETGPLPGGASAPAPPRSLRNLEALGGRCYRLSLGYPVDFEAWLLPAVEAVAERLVVQAVAGVRGAGRGEGGALVVEGSRLESLAGTVGGVDLREVLAVEEAYLNDVYAVYQTLGVEAAREVIVREVGGVFEVYGIAVNVRHLLLVADYMTRRGRYEPFSRAAFTMDDPLLQRLSFESAYAGLRSAALFGDGDRLESPSSCLTVGNRIRQGTGAFELCYALDV